MDQVTAFFGQVWVQMILMVLLAAVHGYGAAWLAVRMLFRPRNPVKLLGITVFPQGMIPRHRERLANAIGKAVGQELMSQETVLEHLFERDFLRKKIQGLVDSYTDEIVKTDYPSLIEALPENLRKAILDSLESFQESLAEYVRRAVQSEETANAINQFVGKRIDDILNDDVAGLFTDETYTNLLNFLKAKAVSILDEPRLEEEISNFIGKRVSDLAHTETPLRELLSDDAILLIKQKAVEQIEPIVHQLTELATEERTKNQIGSLIKKEVHNYYEQLPFIKRIFVSRENLLREVDDLVDDSLPKRIEETLHGDFFVEEASSFVNKTIDKTIDKPLPELIGTIDAQQLENLGNQLTASVITLLRSPEMRASVANFLETSIEKLRPQKVGDILGSMHSDAASEIKKTLVGGLERLLRNEDTTDMIHRVLSNQVENLLHAPIGKLTRHVSEDKIRKTGATLTETIIDAARQKLPETIKDFDIGGVVRDKVNNYPAEKLESLILSIAKEHLRTIEFFGFLFGLIIGLGQAAFTYWAIFIKVSH